MTGATPSVQVRAPGKLFLLGEYAVLYGGPAIVRAVDRYVVVTVEAAEIVRPSTGAPTGLSAIEVTGLGATLPPLTATWGDDSLQYHSPQPGHELVMTILDGLVAHQVIDAHWGPIKCTIDSRELFHAGYKLGLGSSAAVTHGLLTALTAFKARTASTPSAPLPPDFVFNVHRAFQHGRGSGADIGAGVMGGTYKFRRASDRTLPQMREVVIPDHLHMTPVWAGRPASTAEALGNLAKFKAEHPGQFTAALTPLLELAEDGAAALDVGDAGSFVRICDDYGHILSEFGRTVGIDIMSSAHRELRKIAQASGIAYKPSGAGNGDFGLGFSLDIKALRYFERRAKHAGFTPLALGSGDPCHQF